MAVNAVGYNVFAHSLWGYKTQLMHLPDSVFDLEKSLVYMMLKIPFKRLERMACIA